VYLIFVGQEKYIFFQWGWKIISLGLLVPQKYRESKWKQGAEVRVNLGGHSIK
jgi:hypothetical protein